MEWVDRQEVRFRGAVDLGESPTWEDVQWEVKYLTGGAPRNYKAAFAMLDEFSERASVKVAPDVRELRAKLEVEREEYHRDKIYQAEWDYNKRDDSAKSVWWLIHAIIWMGDEEKADEAAEFLLKVPALDQHLLGYKTRLPGSL